MIGTGIGVTTVRVIVPSAATFAVPVLAVVVVILILIVTVVVLLRAKITVIAVVTAIVKPKKVGPTNITS